MFSVVVSYLLFIMKWTYEPLGKKTIVVCMHLEYGNVNDYLECLGQTWKCLNGNQLGLHKQTPYRVLARIQVLQKTPFYQKFRRIKYTGWCHSGLQRVINSIKKPVILKCFFLSYTLVYSMIIHIMILCTILLLLILFCVYVKHTSN